MKPWDSAALFPIIEEAGGVFTNKKGERTGLGGSAIATNAKLAVRIAEMLTPTTKSFSIIDLDALDFQKSNGLVTVVTQDARSGEVLMVAHADRESLEKTSQTGEMHYRSRTRGLWHKGATSGNTQRVISLDVDCDGDAILARVIPAGPACHTGDPTCFHDAPSPNPLDALDRTIAKRAASPDAASYTNKLLGDRNLRLKKSAKSRASSSWRWLMKITNARKKRRPTSFTTRWSAYARLGSASTTCARCSRNARSSHLNPVKCTTYQMPRHEMKLEIGDACSLPSADQINCEPYTR